VVDLNKNELIGNNHPCQICWLGEDVEYNEAWILQKRLVSERNAGRIPDTLLLLEHKHVFTAGRLTPPAHMLLTPSELNDLGVPFVETDRGGELTYHGPGQLIGYPILKLSDYEMGPKVYVRNLEGLIIDTLAEFGINAHCEQGTTGVWVDQDKIGAIGVKVSGGITHHGFSLNVNADLRFYSYIIPCGIADRGVTSMNQLIGPSITVDSVRVSLLRHFMERFKIAEKPTLPSAL
jgi:lipoyl(octanoyl) transferase